jgi:isopentenyl-diphosphate delta-isomerase type 1
MITALNPSKDNQEMVIIVDEQDQEIALCEKLKAHHEGLLHRAFSVFVFRETPQGFELLLQQRAEHKYHSGGLWTNTCCSHPRPGEQTLDAAKRRLIEEMGIKVPLDLAGAFIYKAILNSGLTEYEYDHVYYGMLEENQEIKFDPEEVQAISWQKIVDLRADIYQNPSKYTAWLSQALEVAQRQLNVTAHS